MNVLLLGGMSLRNRDWVHEVATSLKPLFKKVIVQYYNHWLTGREMDLDYEQQGIASILPELANDYVVLAKSAGVVLSVKAIADGILKPKKCLFAGTALAMVENERLPFADWLKAVDCPVLFVQNTHDPVASFAKLKQYVEDLHKTDCQFIELPGDTHDYEDLPKLKQLVSEFVFG